MKASGSWRPKAAARSQAERARLEQAGKRPRPRLVIPDLRRVIGEIPGYDPRKGASKEYVFYVKRAHAAIEWIHDHLTHVAGEWARGPQPLKLERWEMAIVANLFGWFNRKTKLRRFLECFIGVPRKNGKSTVAAAIVNYFGFVDDEPGAELYSAAANKEQAKLVHHIAAGMCSQDLDLALRSTIFHDSISFDEGRAVYKALTSGALTKHGLNAQLVVVDELHAHQTRDLVDALTTSQGSRRQPLTLFITTSDYDRPSICNEKWDYFAKVRDGIIPDLTALPAIWEATKDDDWTKVATWRKANPNYGVSVKPEYLRRQYRKAREIPAYENTFRRLHLNQRTEQDVRLIPLAHWDQCAEVVEPDPAEPCFGGLDLSSTTDLSSLALYFPDSGVLLVWFWVPAENAEARERRDKVPYLTWGRQGYIKLTPGNVIDYDGIRVDIGAVRDRYPAFTELGVDPWNSTQIQAQLDADGFEVVTFGMGFRDMNAPTKELLRLLAAGDLAHGGHPVLRWNAANVAGETDTVGNVRPSKRRSNERIDGIVASIIAIGRATSQPQDSGSVYDDRGILTLG